MGFSTFTSEIPVRPDDIDMNNHVHNTKYLDYVLAARFEQMTRDYKMSMKDFVDKGLGWVVSACHIQFKRPLVLGDIAVVKTGVKEIGTVNAVVGFEIVRKATGKVAADGTFEYTLINLATGRSEKFTQEIIDHYTI